MRVVLDTNVLVSAALKRASVPAAAVRSVERDHVLLKSAATEKQLFEVLRRPYFLSLVDDDERIWLQNLMQAAEPIMIAERIVVCRDPTDDKFLELAINGQAEVIVTDDADLLTLNPFRGISILRPAAFLEA